MNRFNEGKACDAIIRHLETREGGLRQDVRSPERAGHRAPVELSGSARFHPCGTTTSSTYLLGVKLHDALVRSAIWIQRI